MQWIVHGFMSGVFGVIALEQGAPSWIIGVGCAIGIGCFATYFWKATTSKRMSGAPD